MSIVASVAKDGVAPELRQEGALREERYSCSTARASYAQVRLKAYKGKSIGTKTTLASITIRVKGTPIRTKSLKRYWPGPNTRVFTGEEIGVIKAAEAANATIIANGAGEACMA